MSRPSRPYRYRKQMGGLLDFHGFRKQTEDFLNEIDGDISAANAKIGNLSSLTTTDKSSLVGAINEVAAGGGGGGVNAAFVPQEDHSSTLLHFFIEKPQKTLAKVTALTYMSVCQPG